VGEILCRSEINTDGGLKKSKTLGLSVLAKCKTLMTTVHNVAVMSLSQSSRGNERARVNNRHQRTVTDGWWGGQETLFHWVPQLTTVVTLLATCMYLPSSLLLWYQNLPTGKLFKVKPDINSAGVHPQPKHNRFKMDGGVVAISFTQIYAFL
jgi:hypothetical protein